MERRDSIRRRRHRTAQDLLDFSLEPRCQSLDTESRPVTPALRALQAFSTRKTVTLVEGQIRRKHGVRGIFAPKEEWCGLPTGPQMLPEGAPVEIGVHCNF